MTDAQPLQALLDDASRMPAAPGVALELSKSCDDPNVTVDRLVSILKCDPALVAKILRTANSAYFAARRQVGDLNEAIVRLGLRRVQIIALAFCIMEATSGEARGRGEGDFNYAYFWTHALVTATFADEMARTRRMKHSLEAFVAGLLQDIGVLIIQTCRPREYEGVLNAVARGTEDLQVAESRRLGFNHMEAGELLLRRWHLPDPICLAVGRHHAPETLNNEAASRDLARVCQIGASIAKHLTRDDGRRELVNSAAALAHEYFGMTREDMLAVLGQVRMKLDATAEIFDVRLDEATIRRLDAAIRDRIASGALELIDSPGPAL